LVLPEGIEPQKDADEIVALVVEPKEEKEEAAPVAVPEAESAEPKEEDSQTEA